MDNILISIITPCFNSEKTIERTLESVLNQTYQNYEYIIVDGKSTDNTLSIIEKYKEKFGDKLQVVSEKDSGIYDAMNKGINLATGELIGIVNSDDFYELDALENIVKEYNNEKYAVFYGMMRTIENNKESSIVIYNHEFVKKKMITHPTCFVTKKLYSDLGAYSLEYKSSSDYDFMLRVSQNKEVVFKPIYKVVSNFELGGISSTVVGEKESLEILKKYNIISTKKYYFKKFYLSLAKATTRLRK
ncbi:MAG: glycosyltransferase [Ruminococcaceae bacterium]|nr:glycosyltransferase [Oscillospiraceae bacterium]